MSQAQEATRTRCTFFRTIDNTALAITGIGLFGGIIGLALHDKLIAASFFMAMVAGITTLIELGIYNSAKKRGGCSFEQGFGATGVLLLAATSLMAFMKYGDIISSSAAAEPMAFCGAFGGICLGIVLLKFYIENCFSAGSDTTSHPRGDDYRSVN